MTVAPNHAGAVLTIDLDAITANYRQLCTRVAPGRCAAVVKADAYGLSAIPVATALARAGCTDFFVAHIDEGITLREALAGPHRIFVLNGTPPATEADFRAHGLVPVINSLVQLSGWRAHAARTGETCPVVLQSDSGMSRLGLSPEDVSTIAADATLLEGLRTGLVMSHLACADEPDHPGNAAQLAAFRELRRMLPEAPASLANSSGIFLGKDWHFDLARPGAALYGINPTPHLPNPMRPVLRLSARVIQLREIAKGAGVGYGMTVRAERTMQLATLSIGYADGWPRNACTRAFREGTELPFCGRVSMDSIILDVTQCSPPLREGDFLDLISADQDVDAIAAASGTIGYEILTRLGRRFHRRYCGG